MNWQYAAPVHSSSTLVKLDWRQSLTQLSMSWRLRFSVVALVEKTFTAAIDIFHRLLITIHVELTKQYTFRRYQTLERFCIVSKEAKQNKMSLKLDIVYTV